MADQDFTEKIDKAVKKVLDRQAELGIRTMDATKLHDLVGDFCKIEGWNKPSWAFGTERLQAYGVEFGALDDEGKRVEPSSVGSLWWTATLPWRSPLGGKNGISYERQVLDNLTEQLQKLKLSELTFEEVAILERQVLEFKKINRKHWESGK